MPVQTPGELFEYELSSAYFAEQRVLQLLPMLDQHTDNPQIRLLISDHLAKTERHVVRLEECFRFTRMEPLSIPPQALEGIYGSLQKFLEQEPSQETLDLFCLGLLSQVEHFEIATYRSLLEKARVMGESACVSSLSETLNEEEIELGRVEQLAVRLGVDVIQRAPPQ